MSLLGSQPRPTIVESEIRINRSDNSVIRGHASSAMHALNLTLETPDAALSGTSSACCTILHRGLVQYCTTEL